MLKKPSLPGKEAGRYLLMAAMTGMLVGCGGSSGDGTDPGIDPETGLETEIPLSEQDFDLDGIPNGEDNDADDDGLNDWDGEDNFVDLDDDGLDDITFLTEAEANAGTVVEVTAETPCGYERGTDNASADSEWNNNCVVKRTAKGGQFADSLFAVGIQRVLYCSGFATDADYAEGKDYTDFADGEYGIGSETAAIAFQEAESLAADGIVGPQTWARLQQRVQLLDFGIINESPDTYGFTEGACAGIAMFYQDISASADGLSTVGGGWRLALDTPNEEESVSFSYEKAFGRL